MGEQIIEAVCFNNTALYSMVRAVYASIKGTFWQSKCECMGQATIRFRGKERVEIVEVI